MSRYEARISSARVENRQPVLSRRHPRQSPGHTIEAAAQTVKTKIKIITK